MKKYDTLLLPLALILTTQVAPVYADSENSAAQVATTTIIQNGAGNEAISNITQGSIQKNVGNDAKNKKIATQISNAAILQQGNFNTSYLNVEQWIKQVNKSVKK